MPFQKRLRHKRTYQLLRCSSTKVSMALPAVVGSKSSIALVTVWTNVFREEMIQRSISGLSAKGIGACSKWKLSTLAYNTKNWYVLYKVPKNFLCTSWMPAKSNFKLSHGEALVTRYHRVASAPYFSMVSKGFTTLPKRLLILLPFLSNTKPLLITAL